MNQQGAHRYEDQLLDFAYGELPAAEARSIEAHVKGCARCTGALQEIQGVRQQMSQLAPEPAPDAGLESLFAYAEQAARRVHAGPAPERGFRRWIFAAVGAASLAAVLVVVGVVVNRPELAPVSVAALQKAEARDQLRAQQAAAQEQAQALEQAGAQAKAPVPAAAPVATAAEQPRAGGQDKDQAEPEAEAPKEKELANAPAAAPAQAAQVGRAVRSEYVQRVDVSGSTADRKLATKDEAKYRQTGPDSYDTQQNLTPGRGTRPVLPTTSAPGYSRKSAPQPADGEMVFPNKGKGNVKAAKKPAAKAPMAGSGGGIGSFGDTGHRGGSTDASKAEDDRGSVALGSSFGAKQSGTSLGTARPSAMPPPPPPQAQAQAPAPAPVQAEESSRRREAEGKKLERAKSAPVEQAPADDLASDTVATRDSRAPLAPAPSTPAGAAPSAAPRRAAGGPVAMNAPSKVYSPSAQELFAAANRARPGSPEEIDGLMRALGAGLSGQYRIDALQRLCTRLEDQGDERAFSYCTAWASADPSSGVANERMRKAETRWGARKAKAAPAKADTQQAAPAMKE